MILPDNTAIQIPLPTLYNLAVPSALAVTSLVPVLLKHISNTSLVCPIKVSIHYPSSTLHIFTVLSILAVAINSPVNSNRAVDISPIL
jgi:hypothetical protein